MLLLLPPPWASVCRQIRGTDSESLQVPCPRSRCLPALIGPYLGHQIAYGIDSVLLQVLYQHFSLTPAHLLNVYLCHRSWVSSSCTSCRSLGRHRSWESSSCFSCRSFRRKLGFSAQGLPRTAASCPGFIGRHSSAFICHEMCGWQRTYCSKTKCCIHVPFLPPSALLVNNPVTKLATIRCGVDTEYTLLHLRCRCFLHSSAQLFQVYALFLSA